MKHGGLIPSPRSQFLRGFFSRAAAELYEDRWGQRGLPALLTSATWAAERSVGRGSGWPGRCLEGHTQELPVGCLLPGRSEAWAWEVGTNSSKQFQNMTEAER